MSEEHQEYLDLAMRDHDKILFFYRFFEDRRPVMLYELPERLIYAFPYEEFKEDLNERSQVMLEEGYEQAAREDQMVVFMRDNEERVLISFNMELPPR